MHNMSTVLPHELSLKEKHLEGKRSLLTVGGASRRSPTAWSILRAPVLQGAPSEWPCASLRPDVGAKGTRELGWNLCAQLHPSHRILQHSWGGPEAQSLHGMLGKVLSEPCVVGRSGPRAPMARASCQPQG